MTKRSSLLAAALLTGAAWLTALAASAVGQSRPFGHLGLRISEVFFLLAPIAGVALARARLSRWLDRLEGTRGSKRLGSDDLWAATRTWTVIAMASLVGRAAALLVEGRRTYAFVTGINALDQMGGLTRPAALVGFFVASVAGFLLFGAPAPAPAAKRVSRVLGLTVALFVSVFAFSALARVTYATSALPLRLYALVDTMFALSPIAIVAGVHRLVVRHAPPGAGLELGFTAWTVLALATPLARSALRLMANLGLTQEPGGQYETHLGSSLGLFSNPFGRIVSVLVWLGVAFAILALRERARRRA